MQYRILMCALFFVPITYCMESEHRENKNNLQLTTIPSHMRCMYSRQNLNDDKYEQKSLSFPIELKITRVASMDLKVKLEQVCTLYAISILSRQYVSNGEKTELQKSYFFTDIAKARIKEKKDAYYAKYIAKHEVFDDIIMAILSSFTDVYHSAEALKSIVLTKKLKMACDKHTYDCKTLYIKYIFKNTALKTKGIHTIDIVPCSTTQAVYRRSEFCKQCE